MLSSGIEKQIFHGYDHAPLLSIFDNTLKWQ